MEHTAHPSRTEQRARTTCHVRAEIPIEMRHRLAHLGVDLGLTTAELITEAISLLLRYHDLGHGLPEPTPTDASHRR